MFGFNAKDAKSAKEDFFRGSLDENFTTVDAEVHRGKFLRVSLAFAKHTKTLS